ncbi:MAG TPA: fumarylacetoacetate hydrolase family protein [Thermoguttaceae bacterium]|nr:fumarylacetoacetate hydrolase family protein [Thermoguttaceae bacterium]
MTAKLYRTTAEPVLEFDGECFVLDDVRWDDIFRHETPEQWLLHKRGRVTTAPDDLLPPIGSQEVWAAGVTYFRSRSARMEESADSGGGDFYDRVYSADRPELFFKASPHRVVGHGGHVRIRSDANWNVPEPELTACVSSAGRIFGYTIGNDMSSRDIEGANPLYLPQAKVYDGCCALGPCILLCDDSLDDSTEIRLTIRRGAAEVFSGVTQLEQMKRKPQELVEYLFRDNSFPAGCFLLTGTGVVPPNDFTLQSGDVIRITVGPIGVLENTVQ